MQKHHSRGLRLQLHIIIHVCMHIICEDIDMNNGVLEATEISEQKEDGGLSFKCVGVCCIFICFQYCFHKISTHTRTNTMYHNVAKFTKLLPWKH